ncbi:MAG: HGxxPAAW family protein [Propionicimonas sp.]|uniref:HGxxPAAW family protein n=1 Tax=Propionicimonas sp. TaxID=1955623 RepID=UPI002B1F08F1|nr:HGxxPAAW family protein [Propionicimonas sp.]MEA4945591.1 HGxxPAAW family protein [Propionicimonas sp.]MEA5055000.1 HGxxPAAW family protein [Propionicimonas sp.]MEA5119054.1 HGxxPAAW family protein [Propionicimonas sp.]
MIESAEHTTHTAGGFHHHGRTPAAWAGSIIAAIAFTLGAVAVVISNWNLVWISAVLLVLALVVGGVLRRMGYGQPGA